MKGFLEYIRSILPHRRSRDIALVLGGGGARGYAHIGAIEVLMEHGYNITSVAGTSMGALVGGLFAAGKMDEMKAMALSVTKGKRCRWSTSHWAWTISPRPTI